MLQRAPPSETFKPEEEILILQRIAIGTAAISWWIFCEYLKTRTAKPAPSKFLSFAGLSGGFCLVFYAVIM
jgi:hypothetical protein